MPKTITWIEDDTDIIDSVVHPLEKAGYRFVRLRTVGEALNALEQIREADLILLDMILPLGETERKFSRYPGLNLLQELRQDHGVSTPVVAFTVVSRAKVRQQLEDLDVADIIRKPVRPSELKERVEGVLKRQG